MDPYAANYGGHQFGHWAGQLGDGRAIALGELARPDGAISELQLKGAGPTAYSRRGDGRAVLRSSVREYLCSEAMHWLGVPTTRALSLVATGDDVVRDMFYDGNAQAEPGAIVCRVAPTFLRFGNFELPTMRDDEQLLEQLVGFTLQHWFPEFAGQGADGVAAWLNEIAERTARLIARWQGVGFVHGVMNTDNMSVLGLTIDYGPYGWIDNFDMQWTPNTTDLPQRRYCYGNQPSIGLWNVLRLGEALMPLLQDGGEAIEATAQRYQQVYGSSASDEFGGKLGITFDSERGDGELMKELLDWLGAQETDMTLFFRALAPLLTAAKAPETLPDAIAAAFYGDPTAAHREAGLRWLQRWWQRARQEHGSAEQAATTAAAMQRRNPKFVLRNWLAQTAIEAAENGDNSVLHRLSSVLEKPFDEQPGNDDLAQKRPEWARHKPGCSALSCSS